MVLTSLSRRHLHALIAVLLFGGSIGSTSACSAGWAQDSPGVEEATAPARVFGIAADPWQVDDWSDAVGARPNLIMEFEQWHRDRTLDSHFEAAEERGLTSFMVTWEPWEPVPASLGPEARFEEQPHFNNETIANGQHDDYIRTFARSIAASGLTVYIRYAHEMNGNWYPWSRDPENFVLAWQRIVDIFRSVGATNAQFVFSLNPSLFLDDEQWLRSAEQYWPGDEYVDLLGSTMINFGGEKEYSVAELADRLLLMYDTFGMDMLVSELNTAFEGRVQWLADLRTWLANTAPWVTGIILSQGESRAQIELGALVGDLSWDVTADPATQPVVRGLVRDLTRSAPS